MRAGCFFTIFALGVIWGGGQGLYTIVMSGEQKTVSYAELARVDNVAGWYKVKDASWILADAVAVTGGLVDNDLYVPVQPTGYDGEKYRLIVHVVDEELNRQVTEISKLSEAEQIKRIEAAPKVYLAERPIEGILEYGIESDSRDMEPVVSAFADRLASDYKVIKLGEEPGSPWGYLVALIAGLIMLGVVVFGSVREGSEDQAK